MNVYPKKVCTESVRAIIDSKELETILANHVAKVTGFDADKHTHVRVIRTNRDDADKHTHVRLIRTNRDDASRGPYAEYEVELTNALDVLDLYRETREVLIRVSKKHGFEVAKAYVETFGHAPDFVSVKPDKYTALLDELRRKLSEPAVELPPLPIMK